MHHPIVFSTTHSYAHESRTLSFVLVHEPRSLRVKGISAYPLGTATPFEVGAPLPIAIRFSVFGSAFSNEGEYTQLGLLRWIGAVCIQKWCIGDRMCFLNLNILCRFGQTWESL